MRKVVVAVGLGLVALAAYAAPPPSSTVTTATLGVPTVVDPTDNPRTAAKVLLGRKLFFDKRLSADNSISCATCHDPSYGFADPHALSVGVKGRQSERNSPTILNAVFADVLMWDGRSASLEEQVDLPFSSPTELGLPEEQAALKLRQQGYNELFQEVFHEDVTAANLSKALAAYQRTLIAADTPFDRFVFKHDQGAISAGARRGFQVFLDAKCDSCHLVMTEGLHPFALNYAVFTDSKFHNLGVDAAKANPDPGRYTITGAREDWGRFRTPSLRNVALTAPYFHDGSKATLADVVDFYDKGGGPNPNLDPALHPLNLTPQQKQDLVQFLESLTSPHVAALGGDPDVAAE